jgi:hypothetical protein
VGQDGGISATDLPDGLSEIFLFCGLDIISENQKCFARRVNAGVRLRQLMRLTDKFMRILPANHMVREALDLGSAHSHRHAWELRGNVARPRSRAQTKLEPS